MEYGLIVNQKEIEILEENNIDFTFWDLTDALAGKMTGVEIEIDSESEREQVRIVAMSFCEPRSCIGRLSS